MKKPEGYEETRAAGEFTPVELGGHKLIIKGVEERKSKAGLDMIVVAFDFADDDKQPGYFSQEFQDDVRPDKRWPFLGTKYIMVNAYQSEKCSKDFKGFVASVEKSNQGFQTRWDDQFAAQFKGKRVGATFGEVESEYQGDFYTRNEIRWFIPIDEVADAKIPKKKFAKNSPNRPGAMQPLKDADFKAIVNEDDIPF
jgi:hypothetical protein